MHVLEVDHEISMRMLKASEAKDLFDMTDRSREYLRKWLPWVDDTKSVDDSLQFILNNFELYARRESVSTGIFYQGELAGIAGYNTLDWTNKIASIGYWLDIEQQGKGIMTRAVRALINHAFSEYKFNRIEIYVAYHNQQSQAIPKRLGFQKEGILRQAEWLYDHFVDIIVYGMLKSEWYD